MHATTAAIERVVLLHLEHQLNALDNTDPMAQRAIASIIEDEREHHGRASGQVTTDVMQTALDFIVSRSTEAVIWLGMKL